jgi:hypothetical protein
MIGRTSGLSDAQIHSELDFGPPVMSTFAASTFEQVSIWKVGTPLTVVVSQVLQNSTFQPNAIFYGWYAGELLDSPANANARKAIWDLLSFRYNMRLLGESVGFTLNYLEGFERGRQLRNAVALAPAPYQATTYVDLCTGQLIANFVPIGGAVNSCQILGPHFGVDAQINERFYSLLVNLSDKIALDTSMSAGTKEREIKIMGAFMVGFNQGGLRAASVSYDELFWSGYNLGLTNRVLKKSVAWGRNRKHNRIERSPERNRTAAEMGFSTAC